LKSSESINFDYRQTISFSDIESYAQALVFNNFDRLNSGNNQLEGAKDDEVSLNYRNFNMFNYTTIFGRLSYTKQRDAIIGSVDFDDDDINRTSLPINSIFDQERFTRNWYF
jgi:hypothetical protein